MSEILATYSSSIKIIDPMLTLKGLQLLYERNI
jgi:pantothenate kinase type III